MDRTAGRPTFVLLLLGLVLALLVLILILILILISSVQQPSHAYRTDPAPDLLGVSYTVGEPSPRVPLMPFAAAPPAAFPTATAAAEVAQAALSTLGREPDLAVAFYSPHHAA